jgi:stress response protein YsnF
VIEIRAGVKEELVINKERITETETIETDVRKEQFDIDATDPQVLNRGRR